MCRLSNLLLFDLYQSFRPTTLLFCYYIVLVFLKVFLGILRNSLTLTSSLTPLPPPLQWERGEAGGGRLVRLLMHI